MDSDAVFSLALGLQGTPWRVMEVRFDAELRRLDIDLDFPPGSRFPHPESGQDCPVYDTEMRSWRHLNFFQFEPMKSSPQTALTSKTVLPKKSAMAFLID